MELWTGTCGRVRVRPPAVLSSHAGTPSATDTPGQDGGRRTADGARGQRRGFGPKRPVRLSSDPVPGREPAPRGRPGLRRGPPGPGAVRVGAAGSAARQADPRLRRTSSCGRESVTATRVFVLRCSTSASLALQPNSGLSADPSGPEVARFPACPRPPPPPSSGRGAASLPPVTQLRVPSAAGASTQVPAQCAPSTRVCSPLSPPLPHTGCHSGGHCPTTASQGKDRPQHSCSPARRAQGPSGRAPHVSSACAWRSLLWQAAGAPDTHRL